MAELEILKLLSRKHSPPAEYIQSIVKNERALIVKLADRIANMKDLLAWMKGEITSENLDIAKKYQQENRVLLKAVVKNFKQYLDLKNPITHPFAYQVIELTKFDKQMQKMLNRGIFPEGKL